MKYLVQLVLSVVVAALLAGCATYKASKFYLEEEEKKLPLLTVIGSSNLAAHYIERNLCDSREKTSHGFALVKISGGAEDLMRPVSNRLLVALSGVTLGTVNLLGVPWSKISAHVSLELTLYDADLSELGSYQADGSGHAYIALWYGYSGGGARDAAYADAVREALRNIRPQLRDDFHQLRQNLRSSGPVDTSHLELSLAAYPEWAATIRLTAEQLWEIGELLTDKVRQGVDASQWYRLLGTHSGRLMGERMSDEEGQEFFELLVDWLRKENDRRREVLRASAVGQLERPKFHDAWSASDPYFGLIGVIESDCSTSGVCTYTLGYYFGDIPPTMRKLLVGTADQFYRDRDAVVTTTGLESVKVCEVLFTNNVLSAIKWLE